MSRLHFAIAAEAAGSSARAAGFETRHGKVLTPVFMLSRLFTNGLRMLLRAPVAMLDLKITSVEPVMTLVPVPVEDN